jgi:hypothetical protein
MYCKIRGIKRNRKTNPQNQILTQMRVMRWVKIEGCKYCLEKGNFWTGWKCLVIFTSPLLDAEDMLTFADDNFIPRSDSSLPALIIRVELALDAIPNRLENQD